jgi:Mg/Co/Ni transporter MgtE
MTRSPPTPSRKCPLRHRPAFSRRWTRNEQQDILEEMSPDDAVDVLDEMNEEKSEQLFNLMEDDEKGRCCRANAL